MTAAALARRPVPKDRILGPLLFCVFCASLYFLYPRAFLPGLGHRVSREADQEGTAYVEQRIATQFDQLSAICPSLAFKSCKGADRTNWTDAGRTRPCCYLLGAPGRWSFLKLQTFTGSGRQLVQGGDSWVVELRHNESGVRLPSRVFDEGDGSYLVAFLPRLAGRYAVDAWLYATRCLGYQEFPLDATGEAFDLSGITAEDWCYLGQHVSLEELTIPALGGSSSSGGGGGGSSSGLSRSSIAGGSAAGAAASAIAAAATAAAAQSLRPVAAAGGRRRHGVGAGASAGPLLAPVYRAQHHVFSEASGAVDFDRLTPAEAARWRTAHNASRVVLIGDSTLLMANAVLELAALRRSVPSVPGESWHNVTAVKEGYDPPALAAACAQGRCRELALAPPFLGCRRRGAGSSSSGGGGGASGGGSGEERGVNTSSGMAALEDYTPQPGVLSIQYVRWYPPRTARALWRTRLKHVGPADALIVNFGLHYIKLAPFAFWREVIDRAAPMLAELPTRNVYWRSIMRVDEHESWRGILSAQPSNKSHDRFILTEGRRLLYDLYAERAMRAHGIRVIDVFGLPGVNRDDVHLDLAGFELHNRFLEHLLC